MPITVALIALIGVISAAFVSNIDKWFSKPASNSDGVSNSRLIVPSPSLSIGSANTSSPRSQEQPSDASSNNKKAQPLDRGRIDQQPVARSPYFRKLTGKIVYQNGSEQSFSGFRCFYSDRLYYSPKVESLNTDNYTNAPSIDLAQVVRIDFSERPNNHVRLGIAKLRNGKILENTFFYVEECSWWEEPGIQGKLSDPAIAALFIMGLPNH